MLGVSKGLVEYLGSLGVFLMGGLFEGAGEEIWGWGGDGFVDFERAGEVRGGGRGGGVSSEGGNGAGAFLVLNPSRKGRGVFGTGGGVSKESMANEGVPVRTELDAGREEVSELELITGRLLLSNDMETRDGSPPGGRGGRAGKKSVVKKARYVTYMYMMYHVLDVNSEGCQTVQVIERQFKPWTIYHNYRQV